MAKLPRISNDRVHWYMNELASRIIAESGNPSDRFHLGKMMLRSLKDDPDFIVQIDGATGESITSAEILKKTVQCAVAFRNFGLQTGDVIVLMAPSHVDLAVPFQAALYLGVIIAAVDRTLGVNELQGTFNVDRPKIVFCQSEKAPDIQIVLNALEMDTHIVTFDTGDYLCSFADFLEKYGDDTPVEEFRANEFDPEDAIACLIATSGTTGLPKAAAATHKNMAITAPYWWARYTDFPTPTRMALIGSPLQWLTALVNFVISPILRYTRLQTSQAMTQEHAYYLINTYRPTYTIFSPTFMTTLIKPGDREQCDFTCFESILLGGSAVPNDLMAQIKEIAPDTEVGNGYGMSELTSVAFHIDSPPPGYCGRPMGCFQYRIINTETKEDIFEPHVPGELWIRGPGIIKHYYNNPEATEETFAEGSWFKTGDTFYRDENWNFFFVERIKLLLKYKSNQISPVEVENVIRQHPGVLDVAVTGLPDPECGDLPVACVVKHPDSDVTAQDIKDLVKESLSDSKQLRGGVIFVSDIPMTASTKVHRRKLREMALVMDRE
ncbi:luciferin 4-monooxygenase [Amyelois transitella]|uniref:luciferin 4-monooxygenase n=1 Tax=Amyelois transitella TaxID=680683 RepID=UPI00298F6460|nr:luciferin 4-monooxygenase [Amyelois transitella]XP_060806845.1 luciferin 4-monooxygenase [Amyelois transitella]